MDKQTEEINARNWKLIIGAVSIAVVLCLLGVLAYVLNAAAGLM